jgi:LacI family transcriptional regulator
MTVLGAPVRPEYDISIGPSPEDALRVAGRLLDLPEPPTAAFVIKDATALFLMREARRRGLRVPDDLSVIGYDDTYVASLAEPPLTSVSLDCVGLGGALAKTLIRMLREPGGAPPATVLENRLVERESTAAPAIR